MVNFKRILIVALIGLLGFFAWVNQASLGQNVELKFFSYHVTLIFGIWFLSAFLTGLLIFAILGLPRSISMRRELRYKSEALARLEFEMSRSQNGSHAGTGHIPVVQPQEDIAKRLGL